MANEPNPAAGTLRHVVMSNGIDISTPGIGMVRVAGNWLNANGRLPVCIAKPPKRLDQIANDIEAPSTVALAQAILGRNGNGISQLQTWFTSQTGLLLFPEYAFSSKDFAAVDACVRLHPTPAIILAGFGAVLGSELAALLGSGCLASWQHGEGALSEHARYNAGWCWIHEGLGNTRCVIFVKNYPDQAVEIPAIQNLLTLNSILRIEADDIVLYPLICSDLISAQQNSPQTRIEQSLPTVGKRVAVCTIACNDSPHNGWWRMAIDNVVQMNQGQAVLIFANQSVTKFQADEANDKWRCLSGAFISRMRMPKAPRNLLLHERDISTEVASRGLILRHPAEGVCVGLVGWDLSPAVGLYVWEPRMRLAWSNEQFTPLIGPVEFYETCRFVTRRQAEIVLQFSAAARPPVVTSLQAIASESDPRLVTPRLWPELLDGLNPPEPPRSADELYQDQDDLDLAFGIFAAVQFATDGQSILKGRGRGQVLWADKELRVWRSPRLREEEMLRSLQKLALDGGSAPPLIVIGRGRPIGVGVAAQQVEVSAQRALPEKQTDFTHAISRTAETSDIETARPRSVFWQHMAKVEQILLNPPAELAPAICAAIIDELNIN